MSHTMRRLLPAITLCAIGIGAGGAFAGDAPTTQIAQMQRKIDQLEAKVQTLEEKQEQNQADVTAAIQQVMNDANDHSQMLGTLGSGSGWDEIEGFHLGSDDGRFYLHPIVLMQFRGVADDRQGVQAGQTGADVPEKGSNAQTGF